MRKQDCYSCKASEKNNLVTDEAYCVDSKQKDVQDMGERETKKE